LGPGDSKLLCGPTTIIEGRRDVTDREEGRLEKRKAEKLLLFLKARAETAS